MAFQFNQLDNIKDFDEAAAILDEEYIPELLRVFASSPEGQAYLDAQPEDEQYIGDWAGNFVQFGYLYLGVPLPKIKETHAREILLNLFPRKLSLFDPDEAETIVPELIAFWEFLKRQYKQRHSKKILAFLRQIEPTFADTMNDPSNFGMAKSFLASGQAAGFDMTTQEGVEAYQQEYNRQLRETGSTPPGFPAFSKPQPPPMDSSPFQLPEGVPPEFVALMSQKMGLGAVPGLEHLPSDPEQLIDALARRLVESGEVTLGEGEPDAGFQDDQQALTQEIQAHSLQEINDQYKRTLSDEEAALLQNLTITETEPGPIVRDFETILATLSDRSLPVTGKLNQFPAKVLGELNQQMSQPIQIGLKRPQQKSYPNLHGLYLLLRATNIVKLSNVGKKLHMQLDPEVYASWQALNPTEKYFTLLEAWLIRGDGELLGEKRSFLNEGTRVMRQWPLLMTQKSTYRNYDDQASLTYWPGLHNVALMQMFGWVEVQSPKPTAGKGWRVKQMKPLPLGNAIAVMTFNATLEQNMMWDSQQDYTQPWGDLQPYFQPYFPEWQQNLASPAPQSHQVGTYIFKVFLGKIWRRISISSESTLDQLSGLILTAVDFDFDHLDMFVFKDVSGRTVEVNHPYNSYAGGPYTDEVQIGDLPLKPGMSMTYVFDFGDNWEFSVLLEEIQPGKPKRKSDKILEAHGEAPEQYPDWDEEY